ncbi:hypothetical protein OBK27_13255 [Empedobacter falsenii]
MKKYIFSLLIALLYGCGENSKTPISSKDESTQKIYSNGDLTFEDSIDIIDSSKNVSQKSSEEILKEEGWEKSIIENGIMPFCYNFTPKRVNIDNSLNVIVGGGTDVVIKLMNVKTDKCIRYMYINNASSYSIKGIPEGRYYLKIAYGKNWFSKKENGKCIGKFIKNPMYEKGEDIMDFTLVHSNNGYQIPSYELHLDVISTSAVNSFNSTGISEESFNN